MLKMSTLAVAASLSATILLSAAGAHATQQIFTNFGPKKTFDPSAYAIVLGPVEGGGNGTFYSATQFSTPTSSSTLDHIDLALADGSCGVSSSVGASVDLVADNGGVPSERTPVLKHWLLTKLPNFCGTVKPTKLSVPLTVSITLAAGTSYWVVVMPIGFDDATTWYLGLANNGMSVVSSDGAQTWNPNVIFGLPRPDALDVWIR